MKGEISPFWSEMWKPIWLKLLKNKEAPFDLSCELYRSITQSFKKQMTIEEIADIVDDPTQAFEALKKVKKEQFKDDLAVIEYMEGVYNILIEDFEKLELAEGYKESVERFINKYNLKYYISTPFRFTVSISGIFSQLIAAFKTYAKGNTHLLQMTEDFESALADLRCSSSESKIKTCIQKQMNLIEAIGLSHPGRVSSTFGQICDDLNGHHVWPHNKVKESVTSLYTFASDYPGVRHAGNPKNALRPLNMNDLVAITISTLGFLPYLCNSINTRTIVQK